MAIVIWFILCVVVGSMGSNRSIGGFWAFVIAAVLSPLIGFIVVLCSSKKK